MDSFANLPTELILEVLKQLPDIQSLLNVIQASPAVSGVFDECAVEITTALVASTFSGPLHELFYKASIVRSITLSPYQQFFDSYIYGNIGNSQLPQESSVLLSLLYDACNIQKLAHLCLKELLDRVHAITPSHVVDRYNFRWSYTGQIHAPKSFTYKPQDVGPPSWVEEQRVLKGIWRLLVFFELRNAASAAGSAAGWPAEVRIELQSSTPSQFWARLEEWEIDEMECVYECLSVIAKSDLVKVSAYNPTVPLMHLPIANAVHPIWPVSAPREDALGKIRGQHYEAILWRVPAISQFRSMSRLSNHNPLQGTSFEPFRRLGSGIWDERRMTGLEMRHNTNETVRGVVVAEDLMGVGKSYVSPLFHMPLVTFTWASVLESSSEWYLKS